MPRGVDVCGVGGNLVGASAENAADGGDRTPARFEGILVGHAPMITFLRDYAVAGRESS